MKAEKSPIQTVTSWIRRQPPKVKAFLCVVSAMTVLVSLRVIVHEHDNLFISSEAVHAVGIFVLIYKLTKEKTCAGISLKTQELTALFLAVRLHCSFAKFDELFIDLDKNPKFSETLILDSLRFVFLFFWYCGSNIWPNIYLSELEGAFKALGKLMFEVGLMVAYHCDQYASKSIKQHEMENLEKILLASRCHKGRMLYYFPARDRHDKDSMSSWCGWHANHGLTRAIFPRDSVEVPCPDPVSGLYQHGWVTLSRLYIGKMK